MGFYSSITGVFNVKFKRTNPIVPATNEPIKIAILEVLIITGMLYARRSMKIDIVNPMPPKKPIPRIYTHFTSAGKEHMPELTPALEKSHIPKGFPNINPAIIPRLKF